MYDFFKIWELSAFFVPAVSKQGGEKFGRKTG